MAILIVEERNVFGNDLIYPVCERSKELTALTGHKTITEDSKRKLKAMGHTLVVREKTL